MDIEERYNLRDLGGYPTRDGRRLRSGLLFRSATIAQIPKEDRQTFEALGIRLVIDLRSRNERAQSPATHGFATWASEGTESRADLRSTWLAPGLTAIRTTELMLDVYRALPDEQALSYAEMMRRIARGELPLLFHCAAGKDRTGVASALLLDTLGVARETIEMDYLLTRRGIARAIEETKLAMVRLGVEILDDSVLEPVAGVDASYLDAMFAAVRDQYGSVEGYMTGKLGLSPADLDLIRERLLQ